MRFGGFTRATSRRSSTSRRGFTLVEVLVVLAIVALAMGLVGTAVRPVRERNLLVRTTAALADLMAQARDDAIRTGVPRRLIFDPSERAVFVAETGRRLRIDSGIALTLIAAVEVSSDRRPTLLFLPDGTGSGGRLTARSGSTERTLRISWLTGAITDEHR